MKNFAKIGALLSILFCSSIVYAIPNAWLSTRYTRYNPTYMSSRQRSPVTGGHLDILLLADNVTFTDLEFAIVYDSDTVQDIGTGSINDVISGLSVDSVTIQNLDGSMKKATILFSGNVTLGAIQYESDAICSIRFIPIAEGTMPVSLWESEWTRYPASYKTCSLAIKNNGVSVDFERKEWNDDTVLFTFTDKTDATIIYHYDFNFGNPITNGFLRVVYEDDSIQDFSSDAPGSNTIANPYGGYFITPQADGVTYTLMFPEYYDAGPLTLNRGYSISHTQPEVCVFIKEVAEGGSIPVSTNDIVLTIQLDGIGENFASHQYNAAIAGDITGVLNSTLAISAIDSNSLELTIEGGLGEDYYNLYLYKDGLIVGRSWFNTSFYYDVTFTVTDQNSNVLPDSQILIPQYGMFGMHNIEQITDPNGQATFALPGNSEWGNSYQFYVTHSGYESFEGYVDVYDGNVAVPVTMIPAAGVNFSEFTVLATWWASQDCAWTGNCDGFDYNYDGTVDINDLAEFSRRWLLN